MLALALLGSGCVAVTPARMALPPELEDAPRQRLAGVGFGRDGQALLDGRPLAFRRGADRWVFFDRVSRDKASLQYRLGAPAGSAATGPAGATTPEVVADCQARRTEVTVGVVAGTPSPWTLRCTVEGAGQALGLGAGAGQLEGSERGSAAQTREVFEGRYRVGHLTLQLGSVHRFEGSSLPSRRPLGVVARQGDLAVAAVELTDAEPVLIRRAATGPEARQVLEAATQALLAVALVWDPRENP